MPREISIRLSVEDADRVKAVLQSVGATGEQAFAAFERGATAGAQSFAKLERSLDPVVASQQRFAAAQAGITRAVESGLASQERANQLLDLARRRYLEFDDAQGKVAGGSSKFSQVIGQAGFQLQDFVVQVGSGQNALVALGQQGSQLLGIFGGFGAVAGAGLAIVAMAANFAIGKSAAEKLSEELDRQQTEYEAAAKRAQDYQSALRAQGDQYRSAAEAGQRYRDGLRGEGDTLIELTRYYQGLTDARLAYERQQFSFGSNRQNALNTLGLQREVTRTLSRPLTQAAPDMAGLEPLAGIGGGALPAMSQPDYQQATAAIARFRGENTLTADAVLQLRQALQGAVDLNGSYAASINAMIIGLDALIPQIERLDEAQRRANVRQLAMSGQASPEQLRALADQATREVGGTYQQRQRIQELRGDLRGGLPGADAEQTAAIRSSLQALAAQEEGLTPATTQLLRGLSDQARLAGVAAGAARDLAASDVALDNAARQAGLGQASLADKTEARRLVQRRLDGALMDGLEALNRQINGAQDLAAAQLQGAAAVREVEARLRAETEALKTRAEADEGYTRVVETLTTRYLALAEAQAQARSNAAEVQQQQQLDLLRTEAQLVGANVAEREREIALLRERQKLANEGVTDSAAQARRLALAGQIADETLALRRQQEAWNELSNVGVQAFDRIGQAITQALTNGQLGTTRFANVAKGALSEVIQYLAKVSLLNPTLNALLGTSRPTLGATLGSIGQGASSGPSILSGLGQSLGLSGSDGLFSGLGPAVSSFLATPLFGSAAQAAATNSALASMGGLYGPATPSAVAAAGGYANGLPTIGGALGGVGLGFGAGMLTSSLVGGARGTVGPGGMIGAGAGALAGAAIGSIIPGIGTVIGGLIGGALGGAGGGLFGPTQKGMAKRSGGDVFFGLDAAGRLVITGAGGKRWDEAGSRAAVQQQFDQINAALSQRDLRFEGVGGVLGFGQASRNPRALDSAALTRGLRSGNANVQTALGTLGGRGAGLEDALNATDFVRGVYEPMVKLASPIDQVADAIEALNKKFGDAITRAQELGLATDKLSLAQQREIDKLTLGRDRDGLRLVASQQNTLTSFLDNLTYQSASPAERLGLAQDAFGRALTAARGGDIRTADLAAVTRSAATLLQAGQGYYGTGGGAADLERFVRSSIESLGAQLNLPAFGGDLEASLSAAVNPLKDELQMLRDEVAGLREELRTSRLRQAA